MSFARHGSYTFSFEWDENDYYQDNVQTLSRLPTPDVVAEKSEKAFQAALDALQAIGSHLAHSLNQLDTPPHQAELEFGMRLGADVGVITKGMNEAHFKFRLVWQFEDQSNPR
ncbi:MAG: hypothetical protein HC915_00355 [Anaerolineae bacterium]|nr:hypothetical protein [Anaerolineae bacterium]